MKRFLYELTESWKIAATQMRANKTRSMLTALGVIIGIVAVTLMGTAINGISTGFDKSMAVLGDDVLYVGQESWIRTRRLVELSQPKKDQDRVCRAAEPHDRGQPKLEPAPRRSRFQPGFAPSGTTRTRSTTSTSSGPPSISWPSRRSIA